MIYNDYSFKRKKLVVKQIGEYIINRRFVELWHVDKIAFKLSSFTVCSVSYMH